MLAATLALLSARVMAGDPAVVYRQPQLASTGDMVGMTFGAGNAVYYAYSTDHGATFSDPVKVAQEGQLALGRHRGPRIAYQAGNVVVSAIVGQKGKGADGDLFAWLSPDNGKTWSKGIRVNDVEGSAREGLHAMASGNGWVVAVWLDLRKPGARLYGARSSDGGKTWAKNFLIYESPEGRVCECCHPSVLVGPGGAIYAMWRNSLEGARDMYLAVSRDGGQTWGKVSKLGKGTWPLKACPMDGGGMALSATSRLYTVWRREKTVYVALPGGPESDLGIGKDVAVATGLNDHAYAVWTSDTGGVKARSTEIDKDAVLAEKGAYPQVIFTGKRMLAVWEDGQGIATGTVASPALDAASGAQVAPAPRDDPKRAPRLR